MPLGVFSQKTSSEYTFVDAIDNSANPLFLAWIKEWLDYACDRNSQGQTAYKAAFNSLQACTITFEHPDDLQQLRGFGTRLCGRLTEKLQQYCDANGLEMPKRSLKRAAESDSVVGLDNGETLNERPKKVARKRQYVPAYRSGPYGIMMALSSVDRSSAEAAAGMTKQQIVDLAQPYSDSSFTTPPDPSKFYTAWNSVKTLMDKNLVREWSRPLRKYALTDEGWELAAKIRAVAEITDASSGRKQPANKAATGKRKQGTSLETPRAQASTTAPDDDDDSDNSGLFVRQPVNTRPTTDNDIDDDIIVLGSPTTEEPDLPPLQKPEPPKEAVNTANIRPMLIPANAFTVELVLDVREIYAMDNRDYIHKELSNLGITPMVRTLELGDVQWVAKCKDPTLLARLGSEGDEVVLDWIVERKRMDDLIASIQDGRFHEQKFRLRRSGVPNVVYIIEEVPMDSKYYQKYEEAVTSAIASMQVVNGYFVKRTHKMDETIQYLARLTKLLRRVYSQKKLYVVPAVNLTASSFLPVLEKFRAQEPDHSYSVSYDVFATMSSKSGLQTVRDVFLKMLMTLKGITASRAFEIQKRWKTPNEFIEAYERCGTGTEGDKAKARMVYKELSGLGSRVQISLTLSTRLAQIWGGYKTGGT